MTLGPRRFEVKGQDGAGLATVLESLIVMGPMKGGFDMVSKAEVVGQDLVGFKDRQCGQGRAASQWIATVGVGVQKALGHVLT